VSHIHNFISSYLHGQCDRVGENEEEDEVLEALGSDDSPDLELRNTLWNVAPLRLRLQSILDALTLENHIPMSLLLLFLFVFNHLFAVLEIQNTVCKQSSKNLRLTKRTSQASFT